MTTTKKSVREDRGPALQTTFAYVCVRRAIDESLGRNPRPPHYYLAEMGLDERTLYRRFGTFVGNELIKVKGFEEISVAVLLPSKYKVNQGSATKFGVKLTLEDEGGKQHVKVEGPCEAVLKAIDHMPYTYIYLDYPTRKCFEKLSNSQLPFVWEVTEKGLSLLSSLFNKNFDSWEQFRKYIANEVKYARNALRMIIESINTHIQQLVINTSSPKVRTREEIIAGLVATDILSDRLPVPAVTIVMDEDPVIERLRELGLWSRLNQFTIPPLIGAGRDYFIRTVLFRYAVGMPVPLERLINQLPLRVFKELPRSDFIRRLKPLEMAGDIKLLEDSIGREVQVLAREPPEAAVYPPSHLAVERAVNDRLIISIAHRVIGRTRIKFGKDVGGGESGTIAIVYDTLARTPLSLDLLLAKSPYDDWKKDVETLPDVSLRKAVVRDDNRGKAIYTMLRRLQPLTEGMINAGMLIKSDLAGENVVASRSIIPTSLAAKYDQNEKLAREVVSALLFMKYNHGIEVRASDINKELEKLGLPSDDILQTLLDYNLIHSIGEGRYLVASDYRTAFIDYMERALGLPATLRITKSVGVYIDRFYLKNPEAKRIIVEIVKSLVNGKPYSIDKPDQVLGVLPMLKLLRAEVLIETEPSNFDEIAIEGKVVVKPYSGDVENYRSVMEALLHALAIGLGIRDIDVESDLDYTNDKLAKEILKDLPTTTKKLVYGND